MKNKRPVPPGPLGREDEVKDPALTPAGVRSKGHGVVSAAAWTFIMLGGWHTARAAYDNFTLAVMFSSPGFILGMAKATMPVEQPPLASLAVAHIQLIFIFYFFASLALFVSGLGLLLRKAWALNASKCLFYIGAACGLIIFLFPGLLVPQPYVYAGVSLAPEFNTAVAHMKLQLRFVAAFLCVAALWLARRLEKQDVKNEFGLVSMVR